MADNKFEFIPSIPKYLIDKEQDMYLPERRKSMWFEEFKEECRKLGHDYPYFIDGVIHYFYDGHLPGFAALDWTNYDKLS